MIDSFDIPILLVSYNRPTLTKKVFDQIRSITPKKLYFVSDGPKSKADAAIIDEIRDYVKNNIDWQCDFKKLLRKNNLGCRYSVSNGINWFFENEEMGIILEDDCLPSLSFFKFCEELLNKYAKDSRIYSISGFNQQNIWKSEQNDYFFSSLGNCWGWATWKRCWEGYDVEINDFQTFVERNGFKNSLGSNLGKIKEKMIYEGVIKNNADSWALQWGYHRHKNHALTCIPSKSLIRNIGFGEDATHTKFEIFDDVIAHEIDFPLKTNPFVVPDNEYDNLMFIKDNIFKRGLKKIWRTLT